MSARLVWVLIGFGNAFIWGFIFHLIFNTLWITGVAGLVAFVFTIFAGACCIAAGEADDYERRE